MNIINKLQKPSKSMNIDVAGPKSDVPGPWGRFVATRGATRGSKHVFVATRGPHLLDMFFGWELHPQGFMVYYCLKRD